MNMLFGFSSLRGFQKYIILLCFDENNWVFTGAKMLKMIILVFSGAKMPLCVPVLGQNYPKGEANYFWDFHWDTGTHRNEKGLQVFTARFLPWANTTGKMAGTKRKSFLRSPRQSQAL